LRGRFASGKRSLFEHRGGRRNVGHYRGKADEREWAMALDENDDPQIVEVFARFGRAVYMANVVEDSLVRALLQVKFMETKGALIKAEGKGFDRAKITAEWDAYEYEQHGKMMGQLVGAVEKSADLSDDLKNRIKAANRRRNYLVHDYWREQAFTMSTPEGRGEMIEELIADADTFETGR
jgi:hypothetical protein